MAKAKKQNKEKIDYWALRAAKTQEKLTDQSIAAVEVQLRKQFASSRDKVIGQFEATYNHLISSMVEGREPTPADLYKLDKYWKMQAELSYELQQLGDKQAKLLEKKFMDHYKLIYETIAFKGADTFTTMDNEAALRAINSIWCADGQSWSQRVWHNTDKLQQALNEHLVDCVRTGRKPGDLKKILMEDFGVSFRRADTVVRTELAHIQTQAASDRYEAAGIKQIEVLVSPDERTCPICGKLNKKRYSIGAVYPIPAHPNCRCCIIPVIE